LIHYLNVDKLFFLYQVAVFVVLVNIYFLYQSKNELENNWHEQTDAILEEWFDNVAVVIFGILEISPEEEELMKGLCIILVAKPPCNLTFGEIMYAANFIIIFKQCLLRRISTRRKMSRRTRFESFEHNVNNAHES